MLRSFIQPFRMGFNYVFKTLMRRKRISDFQWLMLIVLTIGFTSAYSQGTVEDYKQAISLRKTYEGKVYHTPERFNWIDSTQFCWYVNNTREGDRYMIVNAGNSSQELLFDHSRLADSLSSVLNKLVSPDATKLQGLEVNLAKDSLIFQVDSARIGLSKANYRCKIIEIVEKPERPDWGYWGNSRDELGNDPVASPDKRWTAYVREYNIWLKQNESGEQFQLSYDGSEGDFYSSYIEWSPDSRHFVSCKIDLAEKKFIHFVESSPDDQLQPKLQKREYLKPGDALTQKYPQLFSVSNKRHVSIPVDGIRDQFYVDNVTWRNDGAAFTFEYNQRGHQKFDIVRVDTTGALVPVISETSDTFIDYSGKRFRKDIEKTDEIIWASERDGWNHLYLYDGKTGKVKNQITKGKWVVRSVVHVDEAKRQIIFTASGLDKDMDPYYIHYCKIGFDGKNLVRLTREDGNHKAFFSSDYSYFIDQYSRVDLPPVSLLKNSNDGKVLMTLQSGDDTELKKVGWVAPEIFTAKARDGKTDIWGLIFRPSNFDPAKKYPVIESIYAGPHSAFVPKDFYSRYLSYMQELAELGFIVVKMDGMGTSLRSKKFHDVCYQNIGDAGFPDRKLWIKSAAKKYPYMDIEKVGVFGTSAGGQSAAGALIFHSDFYDVAVSSCGCHDNRMDKIWWNEQWMGKIGPHYEASSNVVNAQQMEGKLMLILGEVDDNVDPASTMQLANALVKSNKDFELVVIPGANHTSGGEYGERKRKDFFVRHLMGVEPPDWSEVYTEE